MKTTYSDFQQIVEKWSKDFGFRNYCTSSEKGWFFIRLSSTEIEFPALQGLSNDLKGYGCELFSVKVNLLDNNNIGLIILNKSY